MLSPLQMERLLAPHGPYGRVLRPSDGKAPESLAYVQCAGSRDQTLGVPYCSRVCCMYAIKQAMLLSGSLPFADITIYYMDIRAFGKGYEEFYRSAKAMGIEFVKGKVARLTEDEDQGVVVRVERIDEYGQVVERKHDLVVLSLGMRPGEDLARLAALEVGDDGFAEVPRPKEAPCRTAQAGFFVAGTVTGPMDIVDTIVEAGAAATEASLYLRERGVTGSPGRLDAMAETHATAAARNDVRVVVMSPQDDSPRADDIAAESAGDPSADIPAEPAKSAATDATDAETTPPRIGVYVCHCGGNISDVVDVQKVADRAAQLPNVVVSRTNTFMCSDPGQTAIAKDIADQGLDRVIVAACSPKLHEKTFRNVLQRSGLNPYLYENVNIREQVSWATDAGADATTKATSLVAAAVAKAARLSPLEPIRVDTTARAVVIGAGVAGLRAASDLARAGIEVALVERAAALGGNASVLDHLFPNEEPAGDLLTRLVEDVLAQPRVTIYTEALVESVSGYIGNFAVTVRQPTQGLVLDDEARRSGAAAGRFVPFHGYVFDAAHGNDATEAAQPVDAVGVEASGGGGPLVAETPATVEIAAGAVIVAAGFDHYVPRKGEYGFERIPQVVTLPDFIRWLSAVEPGAGLPDYDGSPVAGVAFIHCVGSRQAEGVNKPQPDGHINEYCSRVCCTATLQAICDVQAKRPDVATYDFYQDIRAYGRGHEEYYERASKGGTVFVRWNDQEPPTVAKAKPGEDCAALVRARDGLTWGEEVEAGVDLVVLAVGMQPADVSPLVDSLKLPVGADRFLQEVHPKLRPVELSVNGVLVAGTSQGPKDITETAASASAAAAKVTALLSVGHVELDPFVAHVDATRCEGTGACVTECPYTGAVELHDYPDGSRRAIVNPALCSGCGACVAVCPERAIDLAGWSLDQYEAMVDAILAGSEAPDR